MNLRTLKIKARMQLMLVLTLASFFIIICFLLVEFKGVLLNQKYETTKNEVDTAYSLINGYYKKFKSGDMSEQDAKSRAMDVIKSLRYHGNNYFWINDYTPTMVMHPIKPSLDGKELSGFKDPEGTTYLLKW